MGESSLFFVFFSERKGGVVYSAGRFLAGKDERREAGDGRTTWKPWQQSTAGAAFD
jgi:hypothetical protein